MNRLLFLMVIVGVLRGAEPDADSLSSPVEYHFVLQDAPIPMLSMYQVNETYLSAMRMFTRGINASIKNKQIADLIAIGCQSFYFTTFTHEEGHRSVLTAQNIGSIAVPYFNKQGAAYVRGVTDATLRHLRDTNLPVYIRLHTAGLESDYMLATRVEGLSAFNFDAYSNYRWEFIIRKLAIMQYYLSSLFEFEVDLEEEADELDRDIVGFDTYGAIRHLFRPDMQFYRYTDYSDLTKEEKQFVRRTGVRSFLNMVSPLLLGKERFTLLPHITGTFGTGYAMAPFGDFIDEMFWATLYEKIHFNLYFRQFQNRDYWFGGGGFGITRYMLFDRCAINAYGHFWQQPEKLQFTTDQSGFGGAIEMDVSWYFYSGKESWPHGAAITLGCIYKTSGFLPEVLSLDEFTGLRIGTTVQW